MVARYKEIPHILDKPKQPGYHQPVTGSAKPRYILHHRVVAAKPTTLNHRGGVAPYARYANLAQSGEAWCL